MLTAGDPFREAGEETREEETARQIKQSIWQTVMAMREGQDVLASILRDLGLFSPVVGERMAGRHEAAILLLSELEGVNPVLSRVIMARVLGDDDQA